MYCASALRVELCVILLIYLIHPQIEVYGSWKSQIWHVVLWFFLVVIYLRSASQNSKFSKFKPGVFRLDRLNIWFLKFYCTKFL